MVPTFALVFFLAGSIPSAAIYLQPWADAYEAVALTSYFLLLVTYTVPDPQKREAFFHRLQQSKSGGGGSLKWYRVSSGTNFDTPWATVGLTCWDQRTWSLVFQYIPVSFIVAIATDATQAAGKYCVNGHGVHYAHIWVRNSFLPSASDPARVQPG